MIINKGELFSREIKHKLIIKLGKLLAWRMLLNIYSTLEAHFQRGFFYAVVKFSPDFQTIRGNWHNYKHIFFVF